MEIRPMPLYQITVNREEFKVIYKCLYGKENVPTDKVRHIIDELELIADSEGFYNDII